MKNTQRIQTPRDDGNITRLEKLCIEHYANGKRVDEIAKIISLSPFTVRLLLESVSRKLNGKSRANAVAQAISKGLIEI